MHFHFKELREGGGVRMLDNDLLDELTNNNEDLHVTFD